MCTEMNLSILTLLEVFTICHDNILVLFKSFKLFTDHQMKLFYSCLFCSVLY